ncbi:MAG: type IV secretory pathway VirB3-like protein [Acidimicrobiales bacterium]|jgi:type IV secretory pathway VirB3-like protein
MIEPVDDHQIITIMISSIVVPLIAAMGWIIRRLMKKNDKLTMMLVKRNQRQDGVLGEETLLGLDDTGIE